MLKGMNPCSSINMIDVGTHVWSSDDDIICVDEGAQLASGSGARLNGLVKKKALDY